MNRTNPFPRSETLAILARARLFGVLGGEARAMLAAPASIALAAGETLFVAGDEAAFAYLALDGEIAIEIPANGGRSIAVARVLAGDVFGEIGVIDGRPRSASARAVCESRLLPIARAAFQKLLADEPAFARALLTDFAAKVRGANRQVEAVSFKSLPMRLAGLLDEIGGGASFDIRVTQAELALRLGASREKVNMHLQELKAQGAITLNRGRIRCLDPALLAKIYAGR